MVEGENRRACSRALAFASVCSSIFLKDRKKSQQQRRTYYDVPFSTAIFKNHVS